MKRSEFIRLMAAAAASPGLVTGWSAWAQGGATLKQLRVSAPANPSSLDPATGGAGSDHVFLFTLYDTLISWDYDTLQARPGLAQRWEFTNPNTLVLHLREGVKFHDGTALDAEAVKINLDRNRSADFSNIRSDLSSVEEIATEGDLTVVLRLKNPDTAVPLILSDRAGMMVSPQALAANGNRVDRNPVGAGFMKFETWEDGSKIETTRFEDYWDLARSGVSGIRFNIIPDTATRLRSAISGQADVAYQLTGRDLPLIERSARLKAVTSPSIYCYQLYLNLSKKPLDDVRVRQAMNYAVDRDAFVRAALGGAGEPAYMNLPKRHWAWDEKTAGFYRYDPDKARELLAAAGYPDGIDLDMAGYNDQSSVQMQEVLLEQMAKAGIRGRFRNGTIADMSSAYFASGEHDLLLSAWTGRPDPSLTYELVYAQKSYFNAGHVAPPEGYEELLLESRSDDALDARKAALAKLQYLVMEDAMIVPLAFREDITATTTAVDGLHPNLLGKIKFKGVSIQG